MVFIDTHAHIYLEPFKDDYEEIINAALKASVNNIFMPNIDSTTIDKMLRLERQYDSVLSSMMGVHPCSINENFEQELKIAEEWLSKHEFAGIGETGTDLYWDQTFIDQQKTSLEVHIDWAKKYSLPIILHSRDSLEITIDLVEKNHNGNLKGIFHCFSGDINQAKRIIDLGFYLGIGGVLTFRNSGMASMLEDISPEHLVLETDSPYLAPVPHRGKRNEPSYIPAIAEKLATVYDMSVSKIAKITSDNARRVFHI